MVRSLAPHHLVSLGGEGATPLPASYVGIDVRAEHAHLDFVGIHLWPANWGWLEPVAVEASSESSGSLGGRNSSAATAANATLGAAANASLAAALQKAKEYIDVHAAVRAPARAASARAPAPAAACASAPAHAPTRAHSPHPDDPPPP